MLVRMAKNEGERARLLVVGSSDFDLLVRMTKNGDERDRLLVVAGSSDFDLLVWMTKNGGERVIGYLSSAARTLTCSPHREVPSVCRAWPLGHRRGSVVGIASRIGESLPRSPKAMPVVGL